MESIVSKWLLVQAVVLISASAIFSGINGLIYKMAGNYRMTSWLSIYAGITMLIMIYFIIFGPINKPNYIDTGEEHMVSRFVLSLLFVGGVFIWFRARLAEQMYAHCQPLLPKRFSQVAATRLMSVFIGAFGTLLTLWGLVALKCGREYIDQFGTNTTIAIFVAVSGITYMIWSIPGYYRWEKTKKGVELALFATKLVIGILTIIGLIVGYALGRI